MEKIYPKGLRTFARNEKAPDFVLGTLVIDLKELFDWCKAEGAEYLTEYKEKKQLKLTILNGKERINFQVDTYKKPKDDMPF
jgi:hypothetical protein